MSIELQILQSLSDGHFHSGESLASALGVSRTTIWKAIQTIQSQLSLNIQSVKGRGYRLTHCLELLEGAQIEAALSPATRASLDGIDILPVVDSTNRYLMAAASQGVGSGKVILAEQQTAGRGRLGRHWVSPFGCNIYCSLLWRFELAAGVVSGLSMVIAVALVEALANYVDGLKIKWPNDIFWQGQKLAGILLEMQGEANGPAAVVVGLGVNVNMSQFIRPEIDQAWTDLHRIAGKPVSRNALIAVLLEHLVSAIQTFESNGLGRFVATWPQWDMLHDKSVDVVLGHQTVSGIARGIDRTGALRVETSEGIKSYMSGEATLGKTLNRPIIANHD